MNRKDRYTAQREWIEASRRDPRVMRRAADHAAQANRFFGGAIVALLFASALLALSL